LRGYLAARIAPGISIFSLFSFYFVLHIFNVLSMMP
jgi:hypothetical protein